MFYLLVSLDIRIHYYLCVYVSYLLVCINLRVVFSGIFFFQAEDGIRDLVRSRGLGDVYKRQRKTLDDKNPDGWYPEEKITVEQALRCYTINNAYACLLYTSDAADERSSVDLGGRRIIKKKEQQKNRVGDTY